MFTLHVFEKLMEDNCFVDCCPLDSFSCWLCRRLRLAVHLLRGPGLALVGRPARLEQVEVAAAEEHRAPNREDVPVGEIIQVLDAVQDKVHRDLVRFLASLERENHLIPPY